MKIEDSKPGFQKVFFSLGGSVIVLFVILVVSGIYLFRGEIRHQILQRDGVLLTSVTKYLNKNRSTGDLADLDLINLALESSDIEGIIATRVFHPLDELLQSVPASLYPVQLSPEDRRQLEDGLPVIRFFPAYPLYALFDDLDALDSGLAPLIEVIAPLKATDNAPAAAIQYWSDGTQIATEFQVMDRYLLWMGTLLILGAICIFSVLFLYARHRLLGMAYLLNQRNRSLEQANVELSMAARTSAIGSVTSHLFHGLKNPLAGLKTYLKVTGRDEEAVAMTDRMQALIDETLSVLREEDDLEEVQFTMDELVEIVEKRLSKSEQGQASPISISVTGAGQIQARKVQLLILVLRNLVENARDASTSGIPVNIQFKATENSLEVEITDQGPGLPDSVKSRLFEPVQSQKSGGTGIGLAISSVIARHIPANLELKSSNENGTTFVITLSI